VDHFVFRFHYSQVKIYFKENQFMASSRSELYGTTDFLANCGGILGLCLGVSVMSLFEIVYFCTIRLWFNMRRSESDDQDQAMELQITANQTNGMIKLTKDLIADYSSRTTIQGIKYVADNNLLVIERLWWGMIVVISTICCGSLITDAVRQYDQSPVIVSYANEDTSVSEVIYFFILKKLIDRKYSLLDSIPSCHRVSTVNIVRHVQHVLLH
jgi:Amiloride-sensitive sodium channel